MKKLIFICLLLIGCGTNDPQTKVIAKKFTAIEPRMRAGKLFPQTTYYFWANDKHYVEVNMSTYMQNYEGTTFTSEKWQK